MDDSNETRRPVSNRACPLDRGRVSGKERFPRAKRQRLIVPQVGKI